MTFWVAEKQLPAFSWPNIIQGKCFNCNFRLRSYQQQVN